MDAAPFYLLTVLALIRRYHDRLSVASPIAQAFAIGFILVSPSMLFIWL
jgi:hypothetical protein